MTLPTPTRSPRTPLTAHAARGKRRWVACALAALPGLALLALLACGGPDGDAPEADEPAQANAAPPVCSVLGFPTPNTARIITPRLCAATLIR